MAHITKSGYVFFYCPKSQKGGYRYGAETQTDWEQTAGETENTQYVVHDHHALSSARTGGQHHNYESNNLD